MSCFIAVLHLGILLKAVQEQLLLLDGLRTEGAAQDKAVAEAARSLMAGVQV